MASQYSNESHSALPQHQMVCPQKKLFPEASLHHHRNINHHYPQYHPLPMKASLILLILFLVISLHLAEASTLFEGVKKASAIKSNLVKIVLLTGAAFLLLGSILYIRIKVKERSESN